MQSTIINNSLSIVGTDGTPGVPLVNFSNDDDIIDSYQECEVLPKREPKFELTTDAG